MESLAYELTEDGVYVHTNFAVPEDGEWDAMLRFVSSHKEEIRAVLVTGQDGTTPTPGQRQRLAVVIGALSHDVKTALLVDSKFSRGALRALNWLTGRGKRTRPFARSRLEEALDFLQLSEQEKSRARAALEKQRQRAIA